MSSGFEEPFMPRLLYEKSHHLIEVVFLVCQVHEGVNVGFGRIAVMSTEYLPSVGSGYWFIPGVYTAGSDGVNEVDLFIP